MLVVFILTHLVFQLRPVFKWFLVSIFLKNSSKNKDYIGYSFVSINIVICFNRLLPM